MQKIDWTAEARHMVRHVSKHMFEAHRGAMSWKKPGISVVFGNDGAGERQDREIACLRNYLDQHEIEELGFAVSLGAEDHDAGYSWAMLVRDDNPDQFIPVIWSGWLGDHLSDPMSAVFLHVQSSIAKRVIEDHGVKPELVTK